MRYSFILHPRGLIFGDAPSLSGRHYTTLAFINIRSILKKSLARSIKSCANCYCGFSAKTFIHGMFYAHTIAPSFLGQFLLGKIFKPTVVKCKLRCFIEAVYCTVGRWPAFSMRKLYKRKCKYVGVSCILCGKLGSSCPQSVWNCLLTLCWFICTFACWILLPFDWNAW